MHLQIVMDRTGDTRHAFDPHNLASVAEAEQRFRELTGKGFSAIALGKDGRSGVLLRQFAASVEKTLFIPRLAGG